MSASGPMYGPAGVGRRIARYMLVAGLWFGCEFHPRSVCDSRWRVVGHRLVDPIFSTTRAFHVVVIRDAQEMYVLGHPKRRKRQEHTGGRNCSLSDGEGGASLNRRFAFILNQTPPRGCRLSEAATSLNSLGVLAPAQ